MRLTVAQARQYAEQAGFSGVRRDIIVAIAYAESTLDVFATHTNTSGQYAGSTDRGVLQINNQAHPEVTDAAAYNPASAFQAAYAISKGGTDFSAWSTYLSGSYQKYLHNPGNPPAGGNVTAPSDSSGPGSVPILGGIPGGVPILGGAGSVVSGVVNAPGDIAAAISSVPGNLETAGGNLLKWLAPHLIFIGGAFLVGFLLLIELRTESARPAGA